MPHEDVTWCGWTQAEVKESQRTRWNRFKALFHIKPNMAKRHGPDVPLPPLVSDDQHVADWDAAYVTARCKSSGFGVLLNTMAKKNWHLHSWNFDPDTETLKDILAVFVPGDV